MRFYLFLILFGLSFSGIGQIAHYNSFPTMHYYHILDDKLDSISFAFSMRQVNSGYAGPIVRLRRSSDNAELDFYKGKNDIVDVDSIDSWRSGSNVFVKTWYDQSGKGRNAIQNNTARQPQFISNDTLPYFFGDGVDDRLIVQTRLTTLTNNGVNGTVFSVLYSTSKKQVSWGSSASGGNRWFAHLNWDDGRAYFDPGASGNNPRRFTNPVNRWSAITCIRSTTNVAMRSNNVQQFNSLYTKNDYTGNKNFGILFAHGSNANFATNRFTELIMYKYDIALSKIDAIEKSQIAFWRL